MIHAVADVNDFFARVIRGNTLVIPIDNSLLYVEPIYLQAEAAAMLGEKKESLTGRRLSQFIAGDDRAVFDSQVQRLTEAEGHSEWDQRLQSLLGLRPRRPIWAATSL